MAQTPQAGRAGRSHMGAGHDRASCGGLFVCFGWHKAIPYFRSRDSEALEYLPKLIAANDTKKLN
jgi:hypothetical protein